VKVQFKYSRLIYMLFISILILMLLLLLLQDDDGSISFHGVAFVNLAPLLYPGGMCIYVWFNYC